MHRDEKMLWPEDSVYRRCSDYGFILDCIRNNKKFESFKEYLGMGRKIRGDSINIEDNIKNRIKL